MSSARRVAWANTTHDWSTVVDYDHLGQIQNRPDRYAPGGISHLLLEVLAYADEEAESLGRQGNCTVTLYGDGSVAVADDGRGTDTRLDENGRPVKKPIMASKDLRFFERSPSVCLPDGEPRGGLSVVAALSEWLIHTNRRRDGAWIQRYENGIPMADPAAVDGDGTIGTTVHFMPGPAIRPSPRLTPDRVHETASSFPHLDVIVMSQG